LRLLWARIGVPHCAECGEKIVRQTPQQIVDQILEFPEGTKFMILAQIVDQKKGTFEDLFRDLNAQGFARAVVDGETIQLAEAVPLKKTFKHDISVVVDRLVSKKDIIGRLTDSVETGLKLADGRILVELVDAKAGPG
jgi:excinuclease ABC subunit A